jgi:DNA-binding beta-propeller fold protein YncE
MLRRLIQAAVAVVATAALFSPGVASAAVTPLSEFGSYGTGAGQIVNGTQLALDSGGRAYVADYNSNRVDIFSPSGKFDFAFGEDVEPLGGDRCNSTTGCQVGKGNGSAGAVFGPTGVAIGPDGRVYVSEWENDRVSVFTAEGEFLFAFGKKVNSSDESDICTTACQPGESSSEAGAMTRQFQLAFDAEGDLLVAERNRGRVDVFTADGVFLKAYGKGVEVAHGGNVCTAVTGCMNGQLDHTGGALAAESVAVAPNGQIALGEETVSRVSVISPTGEFLFAFGANVNAGSGNPDICTEAAECQAGERNAGTAAIAAAAGIVYDSAGEVLVSDLLNNRVSKFSAAGDFIESFGFGVLDGKPEFQICDATTDCLGGMGGTQAGSVTAPTGLEIDCQGAILVLEQGAGTTRVGRYGESGTPSCGPPEEEAKKPPPGGGQATVTPSNGFSFGKVKLNKKKGTATLIVTVPGPGSLTLKGSGLKKATSSAKASGQVKLPVTPVGKLKKTLMGSLKAKAQAKVTFVPTGGNPLTKTKKLTLKLAG